MEKADFEKLLDNQRKAFNNLLNNNNNSDLSIRIVDFPKKSPDLNVDSPMESDDNIKWVRSNIPPRELTPEEIEKKKIQDEKWKARDKEKALQYKKFGVERNITLVKELRDFTGAGMMHCKICLDRAVYECTTYTKEALFEKAIEFLKELKPVHM